MISSSMRLAFRKMQKKNQPWAKILVTKGFVVVLSSQKMLSP